MIELAPISDSTEEWELIEKEIKELFKREIYLPLLKILDAPASTLKNAKKLPESVASFVSSGRIQFSKGRFSGRFSAAVSKELRAMGAQWDRKTGTFKIPLSSLSAEVKSAISASEFRFKDKIRKMDEALAKILPEEIADKLKISQHFSSALHKTDKKFSDNVKKITVSPELTEEQREKIAEDWQNNMRLFIKDWTQENIKTLRKEVQDSFFKGNRYESMISDIKKSYGVSERKAKFLARQETGLLLAKYKETKYKDVGADIYRWRCVAGTKDHPVRPEHKILDGKFFRWDDPREVDAKGFVKPNGVRKPGENKNPKEDYNCRCMAMPIVSFKEGL